MWSSKHRISINASNNGTVSDLADSGQKKLLPREQHRIAAKYTNSSGHKDQ
jgi:hypothetical protein